MKVPVAAPPHHRPCSPQRSRPWEPPAPLSAASPPPMPPAYSGQRASSDGAHDDEELPTSTGPDSPPVVAPSAVTVRRHASRESERTSVTIPCYDGVHETANLAAVLGASSCSIQIMVNALDSVVCTNEYKNCYFASGLRELRELARGGSAVQGQDLAVRDDTSNEAAFGEMSWGEIARSIAIVLQFCSASCRGQLAICAGPTSAVHCHCNPL